VISKIIDPDGRALQYEYDGATSNGCMSDTNSWWCHLNNLTRVTYQDGNSHTYYYNEASRINKGASCSGAARLFPGFAHLPTAMTGLVDENGDRYISWDYTCDGFADISELNGGVEKVSIDYGYVRSGMLSPNVSHFTGTADAPTISSQYYGYEVVIGAAKNNSFDDTCYECGIYKRSFHDANGNLSYAIDWNGNYHCFAYDMGRNLETARVEVSTSSSCPTLLSATSLVFPMRRTSTDWDPRFRLPARVAEPKKITSYSYDNQGNLLEVSVQATTDITGASGFVATSAGNPRTWSYTYNASGKILSRKGPRADVNDVISYEYDSAGNLAASVNALGHRTEYSGYDVSGRVGKVREPNGAITEYKYSPRGWLISSATTADAVVSQIDYQYDNVGLLTRVTNPDKSYLAYRYDKAHRLIRIDDNLNNSIIYTLDLLGNRIGEQVTDPNGLLVRQISRLFDAKNNIVKLIGSSQ
jgi:YD repeat-containing protein